MAQSPTQIQKLKNANKQSKSKKPKIETNAQKMGKKHGYLYNVGRSITYAAMEKMKNMNPVLSEFSDTNNEIFKVIYKSAIDYRTTYKRGVDFIKASKLYEAADIGLTALKEDIRTGNLYNKERETKLQEKAMGMSDEDNYMNMDMGDLGIDDDWGDDFADFDDNWDDDTSFDDSDEGESSTAVDTLATISSIEGSSKANANTIASAVARSAEYTAEVDIRNTNLLYTHNVQAFGKMNGHLDALNANMGSLLQYMDKNLSSHLSNSTEFFTETTKVLQDQVSLLREIAENTRKIEAKQDDQDNNGKSKITYGSIVDSNGTPDLVEYGKKIKKNAVSYLNEMTGGTLNLMSNGVGEDSNMWAMFAANPYGALLNSVMDKLTPKDLEKAFKDLNKTIGGFFGSMITKFNTMAEDDENGMISKIIGKVFGIRTSAKTDINTAKYNKDKVEWDGKAYKALTEVIPGLLSKQLSAMTGSEEVVFNYDTGKFVTYGNLQESFNKMLESFQKNAAAEPLSELNQMAKDNLAFNSKEEYDKFFEDMAKLFKTSYKKGELINFNSKDFKDKYSDIIDEKTLMAIQALGRELPKNIMMAYNNTMQEEFNRQTKRMEEEEKKGTYNPLFNGNNPNQYAEEVNGKKNKNKSKTKFNTNLLLDTKDNFGRNIFNYMQDIYKELNYIRRFSTGYGGERNGMPFIDPIQNYNVYDSQGNLIIQTVDNTYGNISKNTIKDKRSESEKISESEKKREEKEKANKKFLENQRKRIEKNEELINLSELEEGGIRDNIRINVQVNKNIKKINEKENKKKTDWDKLKEELNINNNKSGKISKFFEKIQETYKNPSSILTEMLTKIDVHLYEMIYGKEDEDGKSVKGIIDHMIFEMRKSFNHFREFMDEKILDPIKDKLGLDKDKSLIKGLMEYFGLDEKKQLFKDQLKEIFGTVKDNVVEVLKGVGEDVFGVVKGVFSPLGSFFDSSNRNFFDKKKKENETESEEDYETSTSDDNAIEKVIRSYEDNVYKNSNELGKADLRRKQITRSQKRRREEEKRVSKRYDRESSQAELKELNNNTDYLNEIREDDKLNDQIIFLQNQISDYKKQIYNLESKSLKTEEDNSQLSKLKSQLQDTENKLKENKDDYTQFRMDLEYRGIDLDDEKNKYQQAKKDIIARNSILKDEEMESFEKDYYDNLFTYFNSNEFKNLPLEEQRRIYEKYSKSEEEEDIINRLKEIEEKKKKYNNLNGVQIGRFNESVGEDAKEVKTITDENGNQTKILQPKMRKTNFDFLIRKLEEEEAKLKEKLNNVYKPNFFKEGVKEIDDINKRIQEYEDAKNFNSDYDDSVYDQFYNTPELKNIKERKKNIQESIINRDDKKIFGLDLKYDKTAKEKLLESLTNIFDNGDENQILDEESKNQINFLRNAVDLLFEGRDSNIKENFEDITIKDILSTKDSAIKKIQDRLDKKIQIKQNKINDGTYKDKKFGTTILDRQISDLERMIKEIEKRYKKFSNLISETYTDMNENGAITIRDKSNEYPEGEEREIDAISAFDRIKEDRKKKEEYDPEKLSNKDRPWKDNLLYNERGSQFLSNSKFMKESMESQVDITKNIDNSLTDILNILRSSNNIDSNNIPGVNMNTPFITPRVKNVFQDPTRNIEAYKEQEVMRNMLTGLKSSITGSIDSFFGRMGIRGFAKGGYIDSDQLAVVGKGEYVINDDKYKEIVEEVRKSIAAVGSDKFNNKIHDQAKNLYQNIATIMGAENIDPNIIVGMLSQTGEAGKAFHDLETKDQQKQFWEVIKIVEQALQQRNEGVLDSKANFTEKGTQGGFVDVFDETFKVYKRTLTKTLNSFLGEDPETEREKSFDTMENILKDAKIYSPDMITGALLGGGASLLTGFVGGPLLGAGVGASIALIKNSQTIQNALFGKQEYDKDGNVIGREGGIIPKDIVNKASKVFPDLKKFGITGAVAGLLPLVPFGPLPGLLIGSGVAFAKNNATVQEKLFGEGGLIDKEAGEKFIKTKLPSILAGAGLGAVASFLPFTGPFGIVGSAVIGSAVGFASTTEKFQKMLFGEYNEDTKEYEGGLVPYVKEKVFNPLVQKGKDAFDTLIHWAKRDILDPLAEAFKPLTRQIQLMFDATFGALGRGIKGWLENTLVVPIREKIKAFLDVVFAPFKNLGKRIIGTIGKAISFIPRTIGAVGRSAKRRQIKKGTANYMTAQERLDYMDEDEDFKFFYNQAKQEKDNAYYSTINEMSSRFGDKKSLFLQGLMLAGEHDKAQDYIKKAFGDVRDEESIGIMNNMLKNVQQHKELNGGRILGNTHGEKKELAEKVKARYMGEYERYKMANPDSDVSFNDFMNKGGEYSKYKKGYQYDNVDKFIAGASNDQISELVTQYNALGVTDKEYRKKKLDSGDQIAKILKNGGLELSRKERKTILQGLDYGQSEMALNYLNNLMQQKGVKEANFENYNKVKELMEEFQIMEGLRKTKDTSKFDFDKKVKEVFGDGAKGILSDEITMKNVFDRLVDEKKNRKKRGLYLSEEDVRDNDQQEKIKEITDSITLVNNTISNKNDEIIKVLQEIRDGRTGKDYEENKEKQKKELADNVYRSEQTLTPEQKKRLELLKKLKIKSIENAPNHLKFMPINELEDYVKTQIDVLEAEYVNDEVIEETKERGYKNVPEFMKKMTPEQFEKYKTTVNSLYNQKREDVSSFINDEEVKRQLDAEGNEVVMKKDSKSGDYEADTTDSSTKKSITIAQRLREKQESFYDSFNNLFKKNDEEEKDDEKKGGWLGKLLAALGIGKGLLGKAKGLLSGVLGNGTIGSLFTRGIFGALGKGALVIGGLMYLPEIIDLFKNHIGPAISENWDNTIKPWLVNDALPRIKEGLLLLVQELPGLLTGTIKFIGSELIPSVLRGIGWSDQDGDGDFDTKDSAQIGGNTAVRYIARNGAKYADSVKKNVTNTLSEKSMSEVGEVITKSATKEGAKEFTEGAVEASAKSASKFGFKNVAKGVVNFAMHPIKSTGKGIVKLGKAGLDGLGKTAGNLFLKADGAVLKKSSDKFITGEVISNVADNSLINKIINAVKDKLVKVLTNGTVINLLGKAKNTSIAKLLLDNFVTKFLKEISKRAAKVGSTALARIVGGIGTGGLVSVGFAVYDFISGFNDARNILGVTAEEVPFGQKILAAIVKTLQGLSIVGTLIPTSWIMKLLTQILSAAGINMNGLEEQQEAAQQELEEYNKENGTDYTLEEYNKEVKGYKSIFGKVADGAKWVGGKVVDGAKWVGNGISKVGSFLYNGYMNGSEILGNLGSSAIQTIGNAAQSFGNFLSNITGYLEKGTEWFKNWADNSILKPLGAVGDLLRPIVNTVADFVVHPLQTIGELITKGLNSIQGALEWISNLDLGNLVNTGWNKVKSFLGFDKEQEETKTTSSLNPTLNSVTTINGMSYGTGDTNEILNNAKEEIADSELGSNIQESVSEYATDKVKSTATDMILNNSNKIKSVATNALQQTSDPTLIGKLTNKVKSLLQSILNNKVVVNVLGQTMTGQPVAKIIYDNFIPKFMQVFAEKLTKSIPQVITRMSSKILSAGTSTIAFAINDFISGFENAEGVLGVIDNASFMEKVIAGMLEAIKGLSLLSIVPSDLIVSLLFDALELAGVNTGNIGKRREQAKQTVDAYNQKNNTSYSVADYNSEVLGRQGFISNITDTVTSGFEKVQNFFGFGKGEEMVNGNPYYSQKEASGGLSKMISDSGCGPTATAMALSKVTGKSISPEQIASDALKNGSWDSEGARGNMFRTEASKYGVKTIDAGGDFEKFDKLVSAGIPTAVSGTYGKGDSPYTSAGHIVTVFGKDKNGNYLVNDPRGEKYSKAYSKEELMNGFRNSWSFGKGEDNEVKTSDSVPQLKQAMSSIKSLTGAKITGRLYNKSSNAMNIASNSIKNTGLIESAGKVIEEVFTKIFTNETIVNLLGNAKNSEYSAASALLANFVPQVIKRLKQNCEANNGNLDKYLRAIISGSSITDISFLVTDFVNAFNNPSANLGKFDTFTIGMKVCSALMSIINNRFVIDKILSANDWIDLIERFVMPIFGESENDIKSIKTQAEKVIKQYTIKASSTAAQKNALQSILSSGVASINNSSSGASLFTKIGNTASNIVKSVGGKVKSVVSSVANTASNIGSSISNAISGIGSWIGNTLFGKGEYVGKGKTKEPASISQDKNVTLGINNFPYFNQHMNYSDMPDLSKTGCGPTSAAMVLSKVTGKTIYPEDIANESYQMGLYDENGSMNSLFPYIGNKYGVNVQAIDNFNKVREYARRGVPMVISGKGGKLYGTNSDGHIVATFGKNKNGYLVNDPSDVESSGSYNEDILRNGFKEAWVFGDQGYLNDLKDAEIVMKKYNPLSLTSEDKLLLDDIRYGKGDPTMKYVNGFPYWSQVDFGGSIMDAGCGPTAASMVFSLTSGQTVNPRDLTEKAKKKGYWTANSGVTNPSKLFPYYAGLYNTDATMITNLNKVKELAAKGYPLIVDGQCSKSSNWSKNCELTPYGPNGHYQALFGKVGDSYVMNDPRGIKYSGKRSEKQLSEGFKYAFKIGDKTYSIDSNKVKEIGTTSGAEDTGSTGITSDSETSATTTSNASGGFFSDMATAAVNFSKKLFGFDIEDTGMPLSAATANSSTGTICSRYSGTDYKAGETVKAYFTAYYPDDSALEGGYVDRTGHTLDPSEHTCAAPKEVPDGTRIQISNTGTSLDGMVYTVTDTGGAIVIKSDGTYRIDILVSREDYKSFQNCNGNITFLGKDGQSTTVGLGDKIINDSEIFGTGENINWGYFCDPKKGGITSYFKEKRSQYGNASGNHGAIDYNVHFQPLYAPKSGTVYSEDEHSSYGKSLTIKTNSGETYYRLAHMSNKAVKKGDKIKQGQYLGKSGDTGHVTGPHVHFEVLKGGTSKYSNGVDPLDYYDTEKYNSTTIVKLKGNDLSFKDYMDKIGSDIVEVNDEDATSTTDNTTTTDSTTTTSNASGGFFSDMATAAVNFSKKLFGFDIEDTTSTAVSTDNTTTTSDSGEYTNASGGNVAEKIFNFGKTKGLSDAATAGVMGNAWCESSFNPAAQGKDSKYNYFGLFQWMDNYGQKESLNKIASEMGVDWTDPNAQLNFMWSQLFDSTHKVWLNKEYPGQGLEGFKKETDAYQAGSKFNKFFEIGKGGGKRAQTAKTIFDKYIKNGKLVNFDQFLKTGKGEEKESFDQKELDNLLFGTGDKVKLSSKIIEYALSFLNKGFAYSNEHRNYINENKNAADCSNYTQHVYDRTTGIDIGTSTEQQYLNEKGKNINKSDLVPSDIVLFKKTRSWETGRTHYKDGVSHSGLYLGDNAFIECSENENGNGIRINDLSSNWSNEHWLIGKRFIDPDKMVDPIVKNPNKLTNFSSAIGSYTIPSMDENDWSLKNVPNGGDSTTDSSTSTASDFFTDMATAAVNFSKKLFGFDIEDTSTATTDSSIDTTDGSVINISASDSEFDKAVHMGDSITQSLTGTIPSERIVAKIGDTAQKGQKKVSEVIKKKPPMVIMNYGTNDAGYIDGWSADYLKKWFTENYGELIDSVKKGLPNAKIVLNQIWDSNDKLYEKGIKILQPTMSSIASSHGAALVDNRSINSAKDYHDKDGIHFVQPFQKLWIESLRSKLVSQGKGDLDNLSKDIDNYFESTLDGVKSSDFGIRDDEFHTGVDYAAEEDTPILSPVSGKVVENMSDNKFGFGNTLVVRDKRGTDHRFAHMRDISRYGLGSKIRKNDIIGNVGSTGRSTGSHLHYEVSKEGTSINPNKYHENNAIGGTKNSLEKVTLSFPDSNQKVDANLNLGKGTKSIDDETLFKLINIIVSVLNKISNNTENIEKIVELLSELQSSSTKTKSTTKTTTVNKNTSDTEKTKTQKLISTLQKGLNSNNIDVSNTQAILDILEKLATE